MQNGQVHVIKLGGSLLDLPNLAERFEAFSRELAGRCGVLIVGGGRGADHVREFDRDHALGEENGHWLAVRAMQLNTYLVVAVLRRARVVANAQDCAGAWAAGELAVVDPLAWLEEEHRHGVTIPHRWTFTSDSIAAHVATRLGATHLTLLKSALPANTKYDDDNAAAGLVDSDFENASAGIGYVELVNLRTQPVERCVIRQASPGPGHGGG